MTIAVVLKVGESGPVESASRADLADRTAPLRSARDGR
jgi:hypothetical protein